MDKMIMNEAKNRLNMFNNDHPKVMPFLEMLKANAVKEGTIVEMRVTTPEGQEYVSNIRLTKTDVETIKLTDFIPR
ncbi:MAG: hypothetical protein IKP31_02610 [Lachnospiraceae bacterium]|nr:hypothetical protein [Lachnospiraceae bacterium]